MAKSESRFCYPSLMPTDRQESVYAFSEDDAAAKSAIAREFIATRRRLNANVDAADNYLV